MNNNQTSVPFLFQSKEDIQGDEGTVVNGENLYIWLEIMINEKSYDFIWLSFHHMRRQTYSWMACSLSYHEFSFPWSLV